MRSRLSLRLVKLNKLSSFSTSISRNTLPPPSSTPAKSNVVTELEQRGLLHDVSSKLVLNHVESPRTVYLGVDPSANSLHLGNLLALIGLLHFRLHGHNAIALIGGATGSVGDPSGRSSERNALDPQVLNSNSIAITNQVESFFSRGTNFAISRTSSRYPSTEAVKDEEKKQNDGEELKVRVENNLSWLGGMGLLEFLSTVGKSARMSTMLSRESVKSRLDSTSGLSFTEFSYQLLQAFDFLTLFKKRQCTIQLGGSDQLGNILSGIELIRKSKQVEEEEVAENVDEAFGITFPLLTSSNGEKFGKSAGNAVWLDPNLTSPLDLYQFFLRTSDEDVLKYLKIFTFIRVVELESIMEEHKTKPNERVAQKILAAEATELVHGSKGLNQALISTTLFFSGDLTKIQIPTHSIEALDGQTSLARATESDPDVPSVLIRLSRFEVLGDPIENIVLKSGLLPSKTQVRKSIESGTLHINGVKVTPKNHSRTLEESDLLHGGLVVLRVGKGNYKSVVVI